MHLFLKYDFSQDARFKYEPVDMPGPGQYNENLSALNKKSFNLLFTEMN